MEPYRLKLKVGEHEFEAEGSEEAVQRQFEMWKDLIATAPRQKDATPVNDPNQEKNLENTDLPRALEKIMRADGRIVSLTAPPELAPEAALLILLGQRQLRSNEAVTGNEMMEGMQQSGFRLARVDRILENLATDGSIIRSGAHRGTRYRLSNIGFTRAQGIARSVLGRIA
jgi:hypothetical protein